MNRKKHTLMPLLAALGLATAEARTLNWVGAGSDKNWSTAANWVDADGQTNAVPRNGDAIVLNAYVAGSVVASAGGSQNDFDALETKRISLKGGWMNPSGKATVFRAGSDGFFCYCFTDYYVPIRLEGTNITFYSQSGQLHKHDADLTSYDGNDCGIVKTGPGDFSLSPGSALTFTGFKYIHLKEGSFTVCVNGSGSPNAMPRGLHTIFSGASTTVRLGANWTCRDGVFSETAAAAGKTHGFSTQNSGAFTLTMTGTPDTDAMKLSATFNGNFSFKWNPDSATKEFALSGSTSTTTGHVTVARGTFRLTDGATFTQLGALALTGGADARFVVDKETRAAFRAAQLTLATGNERLALADGVTLTFDAATVGGTSVPSGFYTGADGAIGRKVDWIEGAGIVYVPGATKTPVAWTWTGNGDDTRVTNPENWGEKGATALPPLTDGSLDATFAQGGTVTVDTNLYLYGITVTAAADLAFAGTDALLLDAGGFTAAGTGAHAYTFGKVGLVAPQTWTTRAGETLNLNGDLYSIGPHAWTLNTTGTVNFAATGHQSGPLALNVGTFNVSADYALGRGNTVTVNGTLAKLAFRGGTWSSLLDFKNASSMTFAENTTNVFLGTVQNKDGVSFSWTVGAGGMVRFKGGNKRGSTGWTYISGPGETHFDAASSYGGSAIGGSKAKIYYNAEKCDVGSNWIYVNDAQMELHTTVPKAFSPDLPQRVWMENPSKGVFWDLHGCDQWVREFRAAHANGLVKSDRGALIHFKTSGYVQTSSTNYVTFAGGAGVSYDDTQFLRLCTPSASTGTVQVTNGRLEMATTWANATAAIAQGGTLKIERADAFGPQVAFAVTSGAQVDLTFASGMKAASLTLDGKRLPDGLYGAGKKNPNGVFAGAGHLRVGEIRLLILVR